MCLVWLASQILARACGVFLGPEWSPFVASLTVVGVLVTAGAMAMARVWTDEDETDDDDE
jgi:hypothetical protein